MGRPKKYTPQEREAVQAEWRSNSNETRRERYQRDAAYRREVMTRSREAYRSTEAQDIKDCSGNLSRLAEFGQVREIGAGNSKVRLLTFTVPELALAIGGYHPGVVRRWITDSMIPEPPFSVMKLPGERGARAKVYSAAQVGRFIPLFAEMQKTKQNFYATDKSFIAALFQAAEM